MANQIATTVRGLTRRITGGQSASDRVSKNNNTNRLTGQPNGIIKYPTDIENYNRMIIQTTGDNVDYPLIAVLPIPQGLSQGDNMSYGSTNLNQVGNIAQDALSNGIGTAVENAKQAASNSGDTTTQAAVLTQILSKSGGVGTKTTDAISDAVMYNKRVVLNPNQVTTFSGSNTRSYSFEFKLVSTSKDESMRIRRLIKLLQYNMYPAGNQIVLKYPSEFKISILKGGSSGEINPYYAPMYNCFLMNITTTYNASSNSYYEDGAPLDVNVTLGFQETKALTREDLQKRYKSEHGDSE